MKKIFKLAKFVGLDYVIRLNGTKKDKAKFKSEAMYLGAVLYIGEDFEPVSSYYQVNGKIIEVKRKGISHYQAERMMEDYPDCYVHGYIDSGTIFANEEVLMFVGLINYGLYRVEEDTSEDCGSGLELCPHEEEDTSEDCSDGSELCADEEDTLEDYSDILELCQHEEEDTEEDTEEDCSSGLELCPHEEEDTSIKGEVTMKFINGKLDMNDCGDGIELCPHKEEDTSKDCRDVLGVYLNKEETSKDYSKTINVYGIKIKTHCVSFGETMLVHEAVENNLTDFLGDLNLERWELFDTDIDCTLCLDEQYNNMVTGFIMFGAALRIFTSDDKHSRDYYLGYMERNYNLREWEIRELANLIDLGINLETSVIEPHSFTLLNCLKSFIHTVYSYICFEHHRLLDFEQVIEKLQTTYWFDKAAKFYLTKVSWGKFKLSYKNDDQNIDDYDYFMAIKNYNVDLRSFEGYDMTEVIFHVAKDLILDAELIERYSSDGAIDIDTAIYILTKWYNQENKKCRGLFNNEQIKLKVLDHVIRKIKGVH